ncbi:MAG: M20 family metallopeptidase [Nitrospinae bacterium]|nr:M20 family metallopeptidase [Nitrospinota bacterium]
MDAAIEAQAVTLTKELIAIPSENPTGDEFAMADRVEAFFRGIGLEVMRERVAERRENVTAEITGARGGHALVFLNHMDTVPAGEGWSRDPFLATEESGKIWGRGSCDMKGGISAGLAAMASLKKRIDGGAKAKGTVRCCMVVDEESGAMIGTEAAIASGHINPDDIVISCEPTELALVTAQKGAMWFELIFSGKSAHAATPHMGADAIHAASHAVVALQEAVTQLHYEDPLLGRCTMITSIIEGGHKTNVVSERCVMQIDSRFVPPLRTADIQGIIHEKAVQACAQVSGVEFSLRATIADRPPVTADTDSAGARLIMQILEEILGAEPEPAGVSYYSDAGMAAAQTGSRNCFLLGPGNIEQAHTPDEFIEVDSLKKAARVYGRLLEKFALGADAP